MGHEFATPLAFIDLKAQRRRLGDQIDQAIARVLEHGQFVLGPEVTEAERQLAEWAGSKRCVTCSSGTDALLLPLMAWQVGPGDAVFVPSFTFIATAEAPALLGASPVFVDVCADDFTMDPTSLEAAIASARKEGLNPKAVIPVDLFGQPADYPALRAIADRHGLRLLADAAQSFGATLNGKPVGSFGDATSTSFFPAKPLGCYGDGGAVTTDDDDLAALLISLRQHGQGEERYHNVRLGLNGRFDTLQAAILLEKLTIFKDEIDRREDAAARYNALLDGHFIVPQKRPGASSVWAQYTILAPERDQLAAGLKANGVPTAVYYPIPLNRQVGYRHYPSAPGGTPVADALAGQVLSLPMHPYLEAAAQSRIAEILIELHNRG